MTLPKKVGQGVLIPGYLILTAAHCIEYSLDGSMALDDHSHVEEINTIMGKFKVRPLAVEPVSDIAVLGSLDNQAAYKEATKFENLCDTIHPISICTDHFEFGEKISAYIHTHKKTWMNATITYWGGPLSNGALAIDTEEQIEGGTSGGPVINELGELLGLISHSSIMTQSCPTCMGVISRPHLALPVWVWRHITSHEFEENNIEPGDI